MTASDSPTWIALRDSAERCIPNKTWCVEGARLRDEADDARDEVLWQSVAVGYARYELLTDRSGTGRTAATLFDAMEHAALADRRLQVSLRTLTEHVRACCLRYLGESS